MYACACRHIRACSISRHTHTYTYMFNGYRRRPSDCVRFLTRCTCMLACSVYKIDSNPVTPPCTGRYDFDGKRVTDTGNRACCASVSFKSVKPVCPFKLSRNALAACSHHGPHVLASVARETPCPRSTAARRGKCQCACVCVCASVSAYECIVDFRRCTAARRDKCRCVRTPNSEKA
jgi:hypothetical protein